VTLDPATTYARTWFRHYGADSSRFEATPPEPLFLAARRTTIADAEGRSRFRGLPADTYLVRSLVTWQERRDSLQQGGVVAALTEVRDPESEVMVHQRVTPDSAAALVVQILEDAELAGRAYRRLGRVTGWSCDTTSEEPARRDLVYKAGRQGADAVVGLECRRRGITFNCLASIECEGVGVGWE